MFYALILDTNGNGIGSHAYAEAPKTYPANEAPCSQVQAQNPMLYQVANGQITESLPAAQTAQIASLQSSFSQAEQAPISFTNAAGITGIFLMTPHAWTKYLGEWTEYVIGKTPLPNNSGTTATFYTPTGTAVEFTLADIENFYKAGKTQIKSAEANLSAKISAVKAATTVSEVHAIVW